MITKYIEVRDNCTLIPAKVEQIDISNPTEVKFYKHRGYGDCKGYTFLTLLDTNQSNYDPYKWSNSRLRELHIWLRKNFSDVINGQVVDIRVILGEATNPAPSEM